ncbi:unnamed protein product [Clavelina lepadiformis]|uniref:Uncharacterized protein n=1 Tax=Clavelina lepadiformis TaxID=159417 RepID=A0ABP0EUZ1_CLALP
MTFNYFEMLNKNRPWLKACQLRKNTTRRTTTFFFDSRTFQINTHMGFAIALAVLTGISFISGAIVVATPYVDLTSKVLVSLTTVITFVSFVLLIVSSSYACCGINKFGCCGGSCNQNTAGVGSHQVTYQQTVSTQQPLLVQSVQPGQPPHNNFVQVAPMMGQQPGTPVPMQTHATTSHGTSGQLLDASAVQQKQQEALDSAQLPPEGGQDYPPPYSL